MFALRFFQQFFIEPANIGAIWPSSRRLAEVITERARVRTASFVVELGPGTGSVTEVILEKLSPQARFFAMEINPKFVDILCKTFPHTHIIQDSAEHLSQYVREFGAETCDCIICGLPFASFSDALQDAVLHEISTVLAPGGRFVSFGYPFGRLLPRGRRFKQKLSSTFSKVETTPIVWKNLPPAFAYCVQND